MGTQIHAGGNYRRVVELVQSGAIGQNRARSTSSGASRWAGGDLPKDPPPVPANLDYDLWLGPVPFGPYQKAYHPESWRQLLGVRQRHARRHGLPLHRPAVLALDLTAPDEGRAEGPPVHAEACPHWLAVNCEFPARGRAAAGQAALVRRRQEAAAIPRVGPAQEHERGRHVRGRQGNAVRRLRQPPPAARGAVRRLQTPGPHNPRLDRPPPRVARSDAKNDPAGPPAASTTAAPWPRPSCSAPSPTARARKSSGTRRTSRSPTPPKPSSTSAANTGRGGGCSGTRRERATGTAAPGAAAANGLPADGKRRHGRFETGYETRRLFVPPPADRLLPPVFAPYRAAAGVRL